jgi:hypothetical protein
MGRKALPASSCTNAHVRFIYINKVCNPGQGLQPSGLALGRRLSTVGIPGEALPSMYFEMLPTIQQCHPIIAPNAPTKQAK